MNSLATGSAGFVWPNVPDPTSDGTDTTPTDYSVIVLDALTYAGTTSNLEDIWGHDRMTFVEGDIRNSSLVHSLMEQVDVVVNFAAESHVDRSVENAQPFVSTNVGNSRALGSRCRYRPRTVCPDFDRRGVRRDSRGEVQRK